MENARLTRGFSLVELLVVMVIMGLVMTSVYSLYVSNLRTATTQEDVVDLQQNLRIAMDWLARDIRMAGFMVPKDQFAVDVASADTITIKTACASGRFAVVSSGFLYNSAGTAPIESPEMVAFFDTTTYCSARIIRPPDHSQPIDAIFSVTGTSSSPPTLTFGNVAGNGEYVAGDVVVFNGGSHPQSVVYTLNTADNLLLRDVGSGSEVIAEGITSMVFAYYLDGSDTPFNTVTGGSRGEIRAVSVTLSGETPAGGPEGAKTRSMNSVIGIRNI